MLTKARSAPLSGLHVCRQLFQSTDSNWVDVPMQSMSSMGWAVLQVLTGLHVCTHPESSTYSFTADDVQSMSSMGCSVLQSFPGCAFPPAEFPSWKLRHPPGATQPSKSAAEQI